MRNARAAAAVIAVVSCALAVGGVAAAGSDEPDGRLVTEADVPSGMAFRDADTSTTVLPVPNLDDRCRSEGSTFPPVRESSVVRVEFSDDDSHAGVIEHIADFADEDDAKAWFDAWRAHVRKATACRVLVQKVGDQQIFRGKLRRLQVGDLGDEAAGIRVFPQNTKHPTSCITEVRIGASVLDIRSMDPIAGLATKACKALVRAAVERFEA